MLVGSTLCAAFVAVCLLARPQAHNGYVLFKADKRVRTAAIARCELTVGDGTVGSTEAPYETAARMSPEQQVARGKIR